MQPKGADVGAAAIEVEVVQVQPPSVGAGGDEAQP